MCAMSTSCIPQSPSMIARILPLKYNYKTFLFSSSSLNNIVLSLSTHATCAVGDLARGIADSDGGFGKPVVPFAHDKAVLSFNAAPYTNDIGRCGVDT